MTEGEVHSRGRAARSGFWAMLQQFVTLGGTALTSVILARTLSEAEFGIFNYATTLASMGSVILTAGLSGLAIKTLVDAPQKQASTMTALIVIRESFALILYCVLLGVSATSGSTDIVGVTAIALTVLLARAFDASEFWFQSRAESGKTAPIRIAVVLTMLIARLALAALGADLVVFIYLYVTESLVVTTLLLIRFLFAPDSPKLASVELKTPKTLLKRSWLLALSGVAAQVNSRGDIVIIQALLGSASVGIYSAAARLSEMMYFLPAVFMTATFPRLLQIRKRSGRGSTEYRDELQASYDRACWAGIGVTLGLLILGPFVLEFLYGQRYSEAGSILQVHALALPFVFMAAVFSKWIIAENLLKASLMRHVLGAVLNIGLNFILIPNYGLLGSAWATVISYVVASFLSCFASRPTRFAGVQMALALIAPARLLYKKLQKGKDR